MARFSKIAKSLLAEVGTIDNLDDVLFACRRPAIGIDDGGVAAARLSDS
jgi:hypothetical protein